MTDLGHGRASVAVQAPARAATAMLGAFMTLELPREEYGQASVQFLDTQGKVLTQQALSSAASESPLASRLRLVAATRQLDIMLPTPGKVLLRPAKAGQPLLIYLPIWVGNLAKGQKAQQTFTITATGTVDRTPVQVALNPSSRTSGPALWRAG